MDIAIVILLHNTKFFKCPTSGKMNHHREGMLEIMK